LTAKVSHLIPRMIDGGLNTQSRAVEYQALEETLHLSLMLPREAVFLRARSVISFKSHSSCTVYQYAGGRQIVIMKPLCRLPRTTLIRWPLLWTGSTHVARAISMPCSNSTTKGETLECNCEGVRLIGRASLSAYWAGKLRNELPPAVPLDDLTDGRWHLG
jgi:hypothetical protein